MASGYDISCWYTKRVVETFEKGNQQKAGHLDGRLVVVISFSSSRTLLGCYTVDRWWINSLTLGCRTYQKRGKRKTGFCWALSKSAPLFFFFIHRFFPLSICFWVLFPPSLSGKAQAPSLLPSGADRRSSLLLRRWANQSRSCYCRALLLTAEGEWSRRRRWRERGEKLSKGWINGRSGLTHTNRKQKKAMKKKKNPNNQPSFSFFAVLLLLLLLYTLLLRMSESISPRAGIWEREGLLYHRERTAQYRLHGRKLELVWQRAV